METFTSYLVESSFKHELHSSYLCLVLTYKHEINNFFSILDLVHWIINNHIFKVKQNNMEHLNQCLLFNTKKPQHCSNQELNLRFLFDLHQNMVTNKHEYVTKVTLI